MGPVIEYDARIDLKRRLTIRGANYNFYHVQEFADGRILLEPRQLVAPAELSKRALKAMDASVANLKKGRASKPIDLSAFEGKKGKR